MLFWSAIILTVSLSYPESLPSLVIVDISAPNRDPNTRNCAVQPDSAEGNSLTKALKFAEYHIITEGVFEEKSYT